MHEAFKRPVLSAYAQRMAPMVEAGIAEWRDSPNLKSFDAYKELTLDLATSIFLGIDLGPESHGMRAAFATTVAASTSAG